MNSTRFISTPFAALTLLLAITLPPYAADRAHPQATANATNRFAVTGMHCQGCARGLTSELTNTCGVVTAAVSLTNKLAIVVYDTNHTSSSKLVKAIEEAGFKAAIKSP